MKTIKNSKEITTLEVGDKVVFGNLEYKVDQIHGYYLSLKNGNKNKLNNEIFKVLNISNRDFVKNLGIDILPTGGLFPEVKSLEALTAIVSALFKEYEKQNELPKTWKEFCERNPIKRGECLISPLCKMHITEAIGVDRDVNEDRNYCISEQEAEAFLAFMQLRQLRKAYVKDWEPDWTDCRIAKYNITCIESVLSIFETVTVHRSMSFPNSNLAKQFFNNFKDLLEIAKPLL